MFLTLRDLERLCFGTEVDRPAHTTDFAADGASAQLRVSLIPRVMSSRGEDAPGRELVYDFVR